MKSFGRWIAKVIGSALIIVLAVILFPYVSRLAEKLLPDLSSRALTASVTLSRHMQDSSRLETVLIQEEGVLTSSTDALLIGTVQQVSVQYAYQASIGIDLTKVEMYPDGSELKLVLPDPEILTDSLTPITIERNDFWYPLTDDQLQKLLQNKKERLRAAYLENACSPEGWETVCRSFDSTIAQWLGGSEQQLSIVYVRAEEK